MDGFIGRLIVILKEKLRDVQQQAKGNKFLQEIASFR